MPSVLPKVRVNVLFFGRIRELLSVAEESVEICDGATLGDLFDLYEARFPQLSAFRGSLVASRNEEFAAWDARLSGNDTIAFLPPVSGG